VNSRKAASSEISQGGPNSKGHAPIFGLGWRALDIRCRPYHFKAELKKRPRPTLTAIQNISFER
jgi:hypothetical protein